MLLRQAIINNNVGWQFSQVSFQAGMAFGAVLLVAVLWSLYWKYRALWHAAKHERKGWFVVLMIVNTLGILEILYLYVFSKYHKS